MVRAPTLALCAICLLCLAGVVVAGWSGGPRASYASAAARHCKTVVKKVHGHKKKVRTCTRTRKTPTPAPSLFNHPSDLVVAGQGNVLVADQGSQSVLTLSPQGKVLSRWTQAGANPSSFAQLYGIALDEAGNVYLSDPGNHVLDKLDSSGKPLAQWDTEAAEVNSFPTLLGVTDGGDVYVSDHTSGSVLHFSPSGALLGTIGAGDFGDPYGVAIGPDGNLYVADFGASRLREFTPAGKQIATWGGANGTVQLDRPEAVAVDGQGNVYLTEQTGHILKIAPSGKQLAGWGPSGSATLADPSGIALDGQGNIYVTEYMGDRVDKLAPTGQVIATWK